MFGALALYSYAVFSGRRHGLHLRHLAAFGLGLSLDAWGTWEMAQMRVAGGEAPAFHNLSGYVALGGMAFHFLLAAAATLLGRAAQANRVFHRVSLGIYSLWLLAFVSGAVFGMAKAMG